MNLFMRIQAILWKKFKAPFVWLWERRPYLGSLSNRYTLQEVTDETGTRFTIYDVRREVVKGAPVIISCQEDYEQTWSIMIDKVQRLNNSII